MPHRAAESAERLPGHTDRDLLCWALLAAAALLLVLAAPLLAGRVYTRDDLAAFHRLLARVASVSIPIDAGNFGLIDRRVARQIAALAESDRYFPGLRSWVGFRQIGIEVERNARYDGQPRVSLRGLVRLAKTAVFSFSSFPLKIFHIIGAVAAALFLYLSCFSLYYKLFTDQAVPGWTSHLLTGSFFGAINALGIAILGEYVIRIYDQVRGRPLYVVDRTVNLEPDAEPAAAAEDELPGDRPYVDLMEEAEQLLSEGSAPQRCEVQPARTEPDYS